MKIVASALLLIGTFCWADTIPASDPVPGSIEIMKLVIAKDIQNRVPTGELTAAKVGDVVVGFSQIRSGIGETTITHQWLLDGRKMADITLALKSSPYRTWSRKTLGEPGEWTLRILNSKGEPLSETKIVVQK